MSAQPNSWVLLEAVRTCLQRITVANGFHTNLGAHVSLEPGQIPQDAALAAAVLLDAIGPAENEAGKVLQAHELATVLVFARVSTSLADSQIQLHRAIQDIKRAFVGQRAAFPGGFQFPRNLSAKPIPPEQGLAFVGAEVRFTCQIPADK